MVQLINGLDFVFLCVAVWLCAIENQSLKQRKKAFEPRKKIAPQHLFTAFLSNFKSRDNSIQSTTVYYYYYFFIIIFFYEDKEIISWLSIVKTKSKRMKRNISGILSSLTFK